MTLMEDILIHIQKILRTIDASNSPKEISIPTFTINHFKNIGCQVSIEKKEGFGSAKPGNTIVLLYFETFMDPHTQLDDIVEPQLLQRKKELLALLNTIATPRDIRIEANNELTELNRRIQNRIKEQALEQGISNPHSIQIIIEYSEKASRPWGFVYTVITDSTKLIQGFEIIFSDKTAWSYENNLSTGVATKTYLNQKGEINDSCKTTQYKDVELTPEYVDTIAEEQERAHREWMIKNFGHY